MWNPDILADISQLSTAVPLAAAALSFRQLGKARRILALMFLLAVLTEAASYCLYRSHAHNLWLVHLWTPVEFTLTLLAFACWQQSGRARRMIHWAIPAFLSLVLVNKFVFESFDNLDGYSRSLGATVLITVAVFTFQRMLLEPGDSLVRDPRLWVSSAVLIYHAGTLTIFTLSRLLFSDDIEAFRVIYSVHSVINIPTNLLFAGGFLCRPRR